MPPTTIQSRKNELVKEVARLSNSAAFRRQKKRYFLEGARLCGDAAQSGVSVSVLFYTARAKEKYSGYLSPVRRIAEREYEISPQVAELLSETKTPQGIFCVCRMGDKPAPLGDLDPAGRFLALEDIQDPANLGTVLRTAEALGIRGVILSSDCCDVYSPKVLRASMGAVFRVPLFAAADFPAAVEKMNRAGFSTYAAVPDRSVLPVTQVDFSKQGCVMLIGNEGNGLKPETIRACTRRVTIPMKGRAESLNASASAAILAWEMMLGGKNPNGKM